MRGEGGGIDGSLALVLLQAYVTSGRGQIRWEHSQAGHTHIDPDVGLGRARGRLLTEEEEVPREQLQLGSARPALEDHLERGNRKWTNEACATKGK